MKSMKDYIKIAAKKKLNRAERRSLFSSISACKNFGTDADEYLASADVYDSIVYAYCRVLRRIGVPFTSFRETERYKFMLSLSMQQTWSEGLGVALKNTTFVNCKDYPISLNKAAGNPYIECFNSIQKGVSPVDAAAKLRANEDERIRWISILHYQDKIVIATYMKKTNKFSLHRCYGKFDGLVDFTEDDIIEYEKGRNLKPIQIPETQEPPKPISPVPLTPVSTPSPLQQPIIKCITIDVPIKVRRIKADDTLKFPEIPRPLTIYRSEV